MDDPFSIIGTLWPMPTGNIRPTRPKYPYYSFVVSGLVSHLHEPDDQPRRHPVGRMMHRRAIRGESMRIFPPEMADDPTPRLP